MRRINTLGLCVIALLAIGAGVTATASAALPELGRCVAVAPGTGEYSTSNCTKPKAGGSFDWQPGPGAKPGFKGKGGATTLETVGKLTVKCKSIADQGTWTNRREAEVTSIVLSGCESLALKATCQSGTGKPGEIVGNPLEQELGFINATAKTPVVGVQLTPTEADAGVLAQFECGGVAVKVTGSVDAPITAVDTMTTAETIKFKGKAGLQEPEHLEGEEKDTLVTEIPTLALKEQSAETATVKNISEEKLEIRAEPVEVLPKWWVAGKLIEGTKEAIAEETTVTAPFKLEFKGKEVGAFTIQCTGAKVVGGNVEGASTRTEKAVIYEKCEIVGKPECSLATIKSRPLRANLEGKAGAIKLNFEPKSGTELAAYHVEHVALEPPCKVEGFYTASGNMRCDYSGVEVETTEHPLEFTAASGSNVAVKKEAGPAIAAGFTVTDKVHLTSGKLWSAK